jgi:integrase
MRGFVTRKGKAWYVVTEQARDEAAGTRRRKWHSGYRTKKEAEAALVSLMSRLQQGTYVEPNKTTLGTFLEEWVTTIRPTVRDTTFTSYDAEIRKHVIPRLGDTRLQALSPGDLNGLYAYLLKHGRLNGRGGLSFKTVRYIHMIVRRALETAVRWNLLVRNPASLADPPRFRGRRPEMRTWTAEQVGAFLQATEGDPLHTVWVLAATTGMRRGELLGLRWRDVDLKNRRLSIQRSLVAAGYETSFTEPKTARGRRSIVIDSRTAAILKEHRLAQLEDRLALGEVYQDQGMVLCRPHGLPIHPDALTKAFIKAVKASGLPRIRLHDLRHTHATLALQTGIHPKVVSERLGHASVAFTLDIYSHAVPAMHEEAAERLGELTWGAAQARGHKD